MRPMLAEPSSHRRNGSDDDIDVVARNQTQPGILCFMTTEAELEATVQESSNERQRKKLRLPARERSVDSSSSPCVTNTPSPPSSPIYSDTMGSIRDFSFPVTPILAGISRSESAVSCASSPHNLSNTSSVFGRFIPDTDRSVREPGDSYNSEEAELDQQFVMPSLMIPSRRKFTAVGRSIGKLTVLVTGAKGIGKSSLVKTISQRCQHIVHTGSPVTNGGDVVETHASTSPRPWWHEDPETSQSFRRRRSSAAADDILDRNITFLECSADITSPNRPVDIVESRSQQLLDRPISDSDLCKLLSNGTEPIVDAVVYLIPHTGPTPTDIKLMARLQLLCNIIPTMAQSDQIPADEVGKHKSSIQEALITAGIQPVMFSTEDKCHTYAVSSAVQMDRDILDASVLMSSGYVPPLHQTDLSVLLDRIFSPDGAAQLRHTAASKLVMRRPFFCANSSSASALTVRRSGEITLASAHLNPFSPMKTWGPVEVASWAQSLRQSLDSERLMSISCSQPSRDQLARVSRELSRSNKNKGRRQRKRKHPTASTHQDPLGLMELAGQMTRNGTYAVELLSGIGIIGYLVACISRPEQANTKVLSNVSQIWLAAF